MIYLIKMRFYTQILALCLLVSSLSGAGVSSAISNGADGAVVTWFNKGWSWLSNNDRLNMATIAASLLAMGYMLYKFKPKPILVEDVLKELSAGQNFESVVRIEELLIRLGETLSSLLSMNFKDKQGLLVKRLINWRHISHEEYFISRPLHFHFFPSEEANYYKQIFKELDDWSDLTFEVNVQSLDQFQIVTYPSFVWSVDIVLRMPSLLAYSKKIQQEILRQAQIDILAWKSEEDRKQKLKEDQNKETQKRLLDILGIIAPGLYEIFNHDNKGYNYIGLDFRYSGGAYIYSSEITGWPIINVGIEFMNLPHDQQVFIIGHELSHYIHFDTHFEEGRPKLVHNLFSKNAGMFPSKSVEWNKGLGFRQTFINASSRVNEASADRSAILDFGASPDAAISYIEKSPQFKEKTFESTHPQNQARIEQLKQLKYDIEIGNIKVRAPVAFDWVKLAKEHRK